MHIEANTLIAPCVIRDLRAHGSRRGDRPGLPDIDYERRQGRRRSRDAAENGREHTDLSIAMVSAHVHMVRSKGRIGQRAKKEPAEGAHW